MGKRLLIPAIAMLLLPALAVLLFTATGGDDAHIAWWSAYSLSEFGAMEQYGGLRVEQGSSLLQVLLLAALHKVTQLPMPALGIGLSLLLGGLAAGVAGALGRQLSGREEVGWATALLTATCYPLVYWSASGLDTSLAALTLTWSVLAALRWMAGEGRGWPAFVAMSLLVMARPEGAFLLAAVLLYVMVGNAAFKVPEAKRQVRKLLALLGCVLLVMGVLMAFRMLYFGRLFPEPVYVKAAGITWYKTRQGIKYLLRYAIHPQMAFWAVAFAASLVVQFRRRSLSGGALWSLGIVLACTGFMVLTGGDWMENARYLAPMLPVVMAQLCMLLPERTDMRRVVLGLVLAGQVAALLFTSARHSRGRPLWTVGNVQHTEGFHPLQYLCKDGERDIPTALCLQEVHEQVRAAKGDTVNIMSGQGGMIIYQLAARHPHQFRWVDIWGLSDRSVADCPPTREVQLIPIPTWSWDKYFELLPLIRQQCPSFPEPDIICELDDVRHMPPLLEANGYVVVYAQEGILTSGDALFPGLALNAGQYIAVKREWAAQVKPHVPSHHFGEALR